MIGLTWSNNSSDTTGINIERALSTNGTWTTVGMAAGSATNFLDSGMPCCTSYWYRVDATNSAGVSPWSNIAGPAVPGGTRHSNKECGNELPSTLNKANRRTMSQQPFDPSCYWDALANTVGRAGFARHVGRVGLMIRSTAAARQARAAARSPPVKRLPHVRPRAVHRACRSHYAGDVRQPDYLGRQHHDCQRRDTGHQHSRCRRRDPHGRDRRAC